MKPSRLFPAAFAALSLVAAVPFLPAAAQAGEGPAPAIKLDLGQKAGLRCAATLALLHSRQVAGDAAALSYPIVAKPAQDYFVRTVASLMEAHALTREQTTDMVMREVGSLTGDDAQFQQLVPICMEQAGIGPS